MTEHPRQLDPLLNQLRRRVWLQTLVFTVPSALLTGTVGWHLAPAWAFWMAVFAVSLVVVVTRFWNPLFKVDAATLAAHLNRAYPALEESAQLWVGEASKLNVLQRLQRSRIEPEWRRVAETPEDWLPPLRVRGSAILSIAALAVVWLPNLETIPREAETITPSPSESAKPFILTLEAVEVTPPDYTARAPFEWSDYNLEVPEGSTVRWLFRSTSEAPLRLVVNDVQRGEQRFEFADASEGLREVSVELMTTSLYRIERDSGAGFEPLSGVYTLTVELDRAPTLRLLEPITTRLDIPRDEIPVFDYRVAVEDDYGIADVTILASVAKGSGEGVKFRDETFAFEQQTQLDDVTTYSRSWNLSDLGMEPGDEIYLFTVARDNQPGGGQNSRSETLVVRWQDDEPELLAADGLAISVMPEYFKSQRQIIIETEQLIADRALLDDADFVAASRELGMAQSELKERYGQYLGDEFGESEAPDGLLAQSDTEEDDHADNHGDHSGHDHQEAELPETNLQTPATAQGLIARFGHDHGAAEVGIISKRSPVGLVKRAVSNMWDAELKLRLADPEAALPFEYDALRYFDLARQADRIYTRRLGFEPPPVSEERRLKGELDDVVSREQSVTAQPDPSRQRMLQSLYRVLSETPVGGEFTAEDLEVLEEATQAFTNMASERPALIKAAALTERLRMQTRFALDDCPDCLTALHRAIWSSLEPVKAAPVRSQRAAMDDLGHAYMQQFNGYLQQQQGQSPPDPEPGSDTNPEGVL